MLKNSCAFWAVVLILNFISYNTSQTFAEYIPDSNPGMLSNPNIPGWCYRKEIVVKRSEIETGLKEFPLLLVITDSNLNQFSQLEREDIVFISFDNEIMDYEIESYDPCSSRVVLWIKIPNLSSTEDNIFYMFCGNQIAQEPQKSEDTWDANYVVVQHFNESALNNTPGHLDSTCNLNDGIPKNFEGIGDSTTDANGKIGKADNFGADDDYVEIGNVNFNYKGSLLWEKSTSNPLIDGCFGSMWYNGPNDMHSYYGKSSSLYHSTSCDGVNWLPDYTYNPVIEPDTGFADCTMTWVENAKWYMLYRSNEWGNGVEIGLATSDDGSNWLKSDYNPVIKPSIGSWDDDGLPYWGIDPWGIIKVGSIYYLWYNTVGVIPRRTGLITSTDLINWQKDQNNPIFDNNRYCVFPFKYGQYYYMLVPYFPGHEWSDIKSWDHQIEIYRDLNPTFYEQDREFLGVILTSGRINQWDQGYLDTPSVLTLDIYRNIFPNDEIWMYYTGREINMGTWREGLAIGNLSSLSGMEPLGEFNIDSITIELWIKFHSVDSDMAFISNDHGYELGLKDGQFYWSLEGTEPQGWSFNTTGFVPDTDRWYHVCFTYSSNSDHNNVNFYVNGQIVYSVDETCVVPGNSNPLFVGNAGPQGVYDFDGIIDELRISKNIKSPEWLMMCYKNQNEPLVLYSTGTNKLILNTDVSSLYVKPGESVIINMDIQDLSRRVNGCQAMLGYDSSYLTAAPGCVVPGGGVWDELIYNSWDIGQGIPEEIDTAIGVWANGSIGTNSDGTIAVISLLAGSAEGQTNFVFRPDDPNNDTKLTMLSDISNRPLFPWKIDSQQIIIDGTPPIIADMNVTTIDEYTAKITVNTFDVLSGVESPPHIDVNGASVLTTIIIDDQGPVYSWLINMDVNTIADLYTIVLTSIDLAGNKATESVQVMLPFCIVNFNDYANISQQWLNSSLNLDSDLNSDGTVDVNDLDLFTDEWLNTCPEGWKLN